MATINCCIVGYGGIAEFHAEALAQIADTRIHSIVGRREEPSEAFAKKHSAAHWFTDLDSALADDDLDAVVIASPSELHVQQTLSAISAGKHVLIEIPLAISHEGARNVAGAARGFGLKVQVAHTRRFDEVGVFVKEFVGSGKTGQIYQNQSYSLWFRHENVGWTGYQRSWVDDILFHHGCHLVDFSLWTIDSDVRRVRGELAPLHPVNGTSMDVSMLIRYANEAIATINLSYNARQPASGNRYLCENGVLEVNGKSVSFNGEEVFQTSENPESGVVVQDRDFIDAIREDREPTCNADEALKSMIVLQQVYDQMITMEGEEKYKRRWKE